LFTLAQVIDIDSNIDIVIVTDTINETTLQLYDTLPHARFKNKIAQYLTSKYPSVSFKSGFTADVTYHIDTPCKPGTSLVQSNVYEYANRPILTSAHIPLFLQGGHQGGIPPSTPSKWALLSLS
jgi:hypothetical protein